MRRLVIRGGRVIDPRANRDAALDVSIDVDSGAIERVGEGLPAEGAEILEAAGLLVFPGFIDLHAHLREPGREHAETIASGLRAAAAGGFTAVCAMPNTDPVTDNRAIAEYVVSKSRGVAATRLYPIGAITKGQLGKELAEFGEMRIAGAVALSDDGKWLSDGALLRHAFQHASLFGMPIVQHCEDPTLSGGAPMHEGAVSTRLGLSGQPAMAEAAAVSRDLLVAELAGGRLHIAHLSTGRALSLVREAKSRGLAVTCEVAPHHLVLTDEEVARSGFSTNAKMNPPLREPEDIEALIAGLEDGTVDAIATDHAPHHEDEKAVEFNVAPFGIVGLETAAALIHDRLVRKGRLSLRRFAALFSTGPAAAFALPGGGLEDGAPADVTVFDPEARATVDPARFESLSRNTPFAGWELLGAPAATVVGGRVVWRRGGA
ncbi:MAG: dihydroorotase [Acidobacteria bacterium]|nr:dihydroorotase [Acidobacteriota bacterium]MCA1610018.1 dihydroorotase [Acidobacteriota bacterium]